MKLLRVIAVLAALLPLPAMAAGTANKIEGVGSATSPMGGVISAYCVSGCGSTTVSVVADTGAPTKVEGIGASGVPLGGVISINCVAGCSGGGGSGTVTQVNTGACLTGGPITTTGTITGTVVINAQTGTSYAIQTSDACKLITLNNAAPVAVSILAATGGFSGGFSTELENLGAGTATLTPAAGTLVNGQATLTLAQNTGCAINSDGTNYQVSACTAIGVGGSVTSITGTANQITASASTGNVTLSLPTAVNTTSVALGGCTIGSDNLCVTGTATISGSLKPGNIDLTNGTGTPALGMYKASSNIIGFATSSSGRFQITATDFLAVTSGGPQMQNAASNCTTAPGFQPQKAAATYGWSTDATPTKLCGVVNGVEVMDVTSTGINNTAIGATTASTINATTYATSGVAGVDCASGTITLLTEVVSKGIVTHC